MIFGIGTDVVEVSRMRESHSKYGESLAKKILTPNEMQMFNDSKIKENFLAKRFAAKEAFAKAMGHGLRGEVNLQAIEIDHDDLGKPFLKFNIELEKKMEKLNIKCSHLSISDEKNIAVAFVILEQG